MQQQPNTPMMLQYPGQQLAYSYPQPMQQRTPSYPMQYMQQPQQGQPPPPVIYYTPQPYVQYAPVYPQQLVYNTQQMQQQQHGAPQPYNDTQSYRTIIQCGKLDPDTNERILTEYSEYFGKDVDIYTAVGDTANRVLYRASTLAEKFNCATNKLGMYLARRRQAADGIYQSSTFRSKPPGKTGLKSGGYFLTLAACKEFENHFIAQTYKRNMHHDWHSENAAILEMDGEHGENGATKRVKTEQLDESIARATSDEDKQLQASKLQTGTAAAVQNSSTSSIQSESVPSNAASSHVENKSKWVSPYLTEAVQSSTSATTSVVNNMINYAPYTVYSHTNMSKSAISLQDEFSKHLSDLTQRSRNTTSSAAQQSSVQVPKFSNWQRTNTFSALTQSDLSAINSSARSTTTTFTATSTTSPQLSSTASSK